MECQKNNEKVIPKDIFCTNFKRNECDELCYRILFLGNPGRGKSTLLNGLLNEPYFNMGLG